MAADAQPGGQRARLRVLPGERSPAPEPVAPPAGSRPPTPAAVAGPPLSELSELSRPGGSAPGRLAAPASAERGAADDEQQLTPHASAVLASDEHLLEVCRLLWPPPAVVRIGSGPLRSRPEPTHELFVASRSTGRPKLLLPAHRGAAAAALRRYSHGTGARERLARQLVALAVRLSGPGRLWPDRITVEGGDAAEGIERYLFEVFGRRAHASLTIGPPRANRKPVLQVIDDRGETLGYVKVGWNDLTRSLVRSEADTLTMLAESPLRLVRVPAVLDHRSWRDLELLTTSPLPLPRWRDREGGAVPLAAMAELAGHPDGVATTAETTRAYAGELSARAQATASADWLPGLPRAAARVASRLHEVVLPFGSWHGDWTPRNMGWSDHRVSLWDWERFSSSAPVGFDVVHYVLHRRLTSGPASGAEVAEVCGRVATAELRRFGLDPEAADLVVDAYLLEIAMRYATDAPGSSSDRLLRLATRLLGVLTSRLG